MSEELSAKASLASECGIYIERRYTNMRFEFTQTHLNAVARQRSNFSVYYSLHILDCEGADQ